ncbi:MAG: Ig-like domain-containing protein [Archaeoglobaceae archaeon]|nr:Ig-like domain-containing protein [Archaeoglobaceae archaeon]MDW8117537.1 Ig-like domain-containing protein [Archaeoglobaceae archaeon]
MTKVIFFYLLLFIFISSTNAVEISTNAKLVGDTYYVVKGEKIEIKISGNPSEELVFSIYYTFILKSSGDHYHFSQNKFPIPISSSFEVKAYPVKNLTVEAKLWIFKKKLSAEAKNDVAIVKAEVPAGKYDVQFYGLANGNYVTIESLATSKIALDEGGKFSISYDTSYLPEGEMTVQIDSKLLKVKIVSLSVSPTPPSYNPPLYNASVVPITEVPQQILIEINPSKTTIILNETLEITIKLRNSLGQPISGLAVFWRVNGSAVKLLNFENETNHLGEATAKIMALSVGEAIVKAEIPDLNASAEALIYVQNETISITYTPQENSSPQIIYSPTQEVYAPPQETVVNTDQNKVEIEKRNFIPGFEVLTAFLSVFCVYLIVRRLGN